MDSNELIDFAILPQVKVQNYENKIDEQNSTIETLSKKVTHLETALEGSKEDKENNVESENSSPFEEPALKEPIVEKPDDSADNIASPEEPKEDFSHSEVGEELDVKSSKIVKGKNLNRQCRVQQLKEKLHDTNYSMPDNIDTLLAAAVGTAKKPISNEDEFYKATFFKI